MTQLVGIFGYPLAHSISPAIQQAAFDYYSLDIRYEAWPTPPDLLGKEVGKLRDQMYLGANVTVPHKERVRDFLDYIDPWAMSIGAVNTIVREDGSLNGYNTDAYGFMRSLRETGQFEARGKRVLILGAGGAARAAVFGLAQEGVASLVIANRTLERAQALAGEIRDSVALVTSVPMTAKAMKQASAEADLIVNSTSVGMWHGSAEGSTPLYAASIPPAALVYDMVYNPQETPLLIEAKKTGARTLGGLRMLIYQGAAAFERWTDKEAPIEVMLQAGEKALEKMVAG